MLLWGGNGPSSSAHHQPEQIQRWRDGCHAAVGCLDPGQHELAGGAGARPDHPIIGSRAATRNSDEIFHRAHGAITCRIRGAKKDGRRRLITCYSQIFSAPRGEPRYDVLVLILIATPVLAAGKNCGANLRQALQRNRQAAMHV
jgi:hypothetical protein